MDISEVILNTVKENNEVRTSAIQEFRVAKLFIANLRTTGSGGGQYA
jgi:hypothetical protein